MPSAVFGFCPLQDHTSESSVSAQSLLAPDADSALLNGAPWEIRSWQCHADGAGANGVGEEPDPVELVLSLSQPGMAVTRVLFLSGRRAYDAAKIPEVRGARSCVRFSDV